MTSSLPPTIIPKALRKGQTIAFISPSARLNEEYPKVTARGKSFFEKRGYPVKVIYSSTKGLSYTDSVKVRVDEVHQAFADPDVRAIVCMVGGSISNDVIPHLDYDLIRRNPKIFVGVSDITWYHNAFLTQTGLQTFYGPCVLSEFAEFPEPDPFTVDHFFHVVQESADREVGPLPRSSVWANELLPFVYEGDDSESLRPRPLKTEWKWARPGKVTSRIVGGCLTLLVRISGSKYWPDPRGKILFIESPMGNNDREALPLYRAAAAIQDLVASGALTGIVGLVIGRSYGLDEDERKEFIQIVKDRCAGTDFPILADVDIGHTSPMLTIPMNALARLDSDANEFSILEPGVVA